jgi:putative transposase
MRKTSFATGEFYHVYNRGTEKRDIFMNNHDYERFLSLLYLANSKDKVDLKRQGSTLSELLSIDKSDLVDICAYCLMPNHFHLIIREKEEGGISKFMQKLITAYTMYFNKIRDRSGTLFQGKFKAVHVDTDRYLKYLLAYVHLNPVKLIEPDWKNIGLMNKSRAVKYLDQYNYSSYRDYSGDKRKESKIISIESIPEYSPDFSVMKKDFLEWLDGQGSTLS